MPDTLKRILNLGNPDAGVPTTGRESFLIAHPGKDLQALPKPRISAIFSGFPGVFTEPVIARKNASPPTAPLAGASFPFCPWHRALAQMLNLEKATSPSDAASA
jgi:hypothetical protein